MNVLVDTPVWSLALRRRVETRHPAAHELRELIREFRARIIGPIRQEILSGIPHSSSFDALRNTLRAFPDEDLVAEDYEQAASFFNTCRARGVQGSNTDFLLCAAATRHGMGILTTDGDFAQFARHLPVRLHRVRVSGA